MTAPTTAAVQAFVLETLAQPLAERGLTAEQVGPDFDLLLENVIDSLGILELVSAVSDEFGLDIDFEELDPEGLTVVGSFSAFVAAQARRDAA